MVLNGKKSKWVSVVSGVPQGSVLGPILFIIYINDMDERIKNLLWKFADDTKLMGNAGTTLGIDSLKTDLKSLEEWSEIWQMPVNADKCKIMHIGGSNTKEQYKMGNVYLAEVAEEKDLGVFINRDMKVATQCIKSANKANQILGLINRTITCKNKTIITTLYKALVRPHLDYCVQAWRPHYSKDIDKIEKVQRRATRMIDGLKGMTYEERLACLKLTTLETRRARADLIEVYKIINGLDRIQIENLFQRNSRDNTRGHSMQFYKKRFRTDFGKFKFSNRVVTDWNKLPECAVRAKSLNVFKNQVDHYLGITRGLR